MNQIYGKFVSLIIFCNVFIVTRIAYLCFFKSLNNTLIINKVQTLSSYIYFNGFINFITKPALIDDSLKCLTIERNPNFKSIYFMEEGLLFAFY